MNSGIYKIINTVTLKIYIGSSVNMSKRKYQHFNSLRNCKHHSRHLQHAFDKYGEVVFSFEVIEDVGEREKLVEREQYWMDTLKPAYNINLFADSPRRTKNTPETNEKVRQANLGLKHPEWRNEIKSKAQGGENHWAYGKEFSDESKAKMSASHKALYESGYKHPRCRKIEKLDLEGNHIAFYDSVKTAATENNMNRVVLTRQLKNGKSKNFIWKYLD